MAAALEIQALYKSYGRHPVLRGVDLTLPEGAIQGLVGLNGAGKTTTLQCSLGLLPFQRGTVRALGLPPTQLHRARGRVAVVFDEACLHPQLTVRQVLEHAALLAGKRPGRGELSSLEETLGIAGYRHFKVRELSLGNRRRTSIAQALVGEPQLLVFDEPFNGLDAGGVDDLLELLRRLNRERGISLLLASHQLSYLERVCSHMAILHRGRIVLAESVARLLESGDSRLHVHAGEPDRAREILQGLEGVRVLDPEPAAAPHAAPQESLLRCDLQGIAAAAVNRALVQAGVEVHELLRQRHSLDQVFRRVTAEGLNA